MDEATAAPDNAAQDRLMTRIAERPPDPAAISSGDASAIAEANR